jgi:hypothetical protein
MGVLFMKRDPHGTPRISVEAAKKDQSRGNKIETGERIEPAELN